MCQDLIIHADSEAFVIAWKKAIDEHIEFSNSSSSMKEHELVQMDVSETGDEPPEMQGKIRVSIIFWLSELT